MRWDKLTSAQKSATKRILGQAAAAGYDTTVSQIAKRFDMAMEFDRGTATIEQLRTAIES